MNADRDPASGRPTMSDSSYPSCLPVPRPSAPATSTAGNVSGTVIVTLLVITGLFWIVLAVLLIVSGLAAGPGGTSLLIGIVGVWDLLVGGYTLSAIKGVVRRSYHAQGPLVLIAVVGAGWALFATIWLGGWFQLLVVPLHIGIGVLALLDSAHFDSAWGRQGPPVRLPAAPLPPPMPPWESPVSDRPAGRVDVGS
jgi:hypothetical protein